MGFFDSFTRAANGEPEGQRYEVAGKIISCSHCGNTLFTQGEAQLNTMGMTLLDLDFLNKSADIFICSNCGHIEWFARI
ncbi:MAG: DNA-binding protein [Coriobacteriales bacterium]